ncbi:hypothetical protein AB0D59_10400 [Streptomyces sp. NPDC048417]|uniref:hypothetical protein n=1 Tax=Streptomyces sp. NPDC048417 TaxID=3155387 RepID=UPI0034130C87
MRSQPRDAQALLLAAGERAGRPATVRAYLDGDHRWTCAGTATTAAAVSPSDYVDVR